MYIMVDLQTIWDVQTKYLENLRKKHTLLFPILVLPIVFSHSI